MRHNAGHSTAQRPRTDLNKRFLPRPNTLGCQIDEYTRLFSTKVTWRKKQTKVFTKSPSYSFIWPYSFIWHLRVEKKQKFAVKVKYNF